MKRIVALVFAVIAVALAALVSGGLLASCATTPPVGADDFAYAAAPFSATLRGTFTPADGVARPIAATVTVGASSGGDAPASARPMRVSFTRPTSLAGVTVEAAYADDGQGGSTCVVIFSHASAYGAVRTESDAGDFEGLLRFAQALLPQGDVVSVSPVNEDGTHTVTRRTAEGDGETVYRFGAGGGLPLQVTARTGEEILELAVSAADGDHAGRP